MLITAFSGSAAFCQENSELNFTQDSSFLALDSLNALQDSVQIDSLLTINKPIPSIDTSISEDAITTKIDYVAKDSIRIDQIEEKIYLYGDAQINYENIQLNAEYIELDLAKNIVIANGVPDSTGEYIGLPIFKEGPQQYEAGKMTYNFETKKGKIEEVKTQEGDGFIKGNEVKKTETDVMYIRNGYYTTCNLEEPHFSLATSKLKIIPNDKIVTGPTVLKIDQVPTPLALPFGFFPNKNGRSSGILIPTYGDSRQLGFFFRDGGFYWGANDYFDASLTGDIYTLGSWATNFRIRYKNRYHYGGNLSLSYSNLKRGYEGFPDYSESKEFFVRWNHQQDAKARPGSRFSANVNIGSRENFVNNLNSFDSDYLTNSFQSSISYLNSFPSKPYNLTISARHDQNTQTGAFNLSLPDVSFNVSRLYPFKNFGKIGNEWWRSMYKNVGVSYNSTATNQLRTYDTLISVNRFPELKEDFNNGVRHAIPINTSFKLFKFFNLNPSFNYSEVWAFRTYRQSFDTLTNKVDLDTVGEFRRGASYNFNANLTTKVYGMYQFRGNGIKAIRHVMTPQVSFIYQPEITTGNESYVNGQGEEVSYNVFQGTVYGSPARRESGRVGLNLLNNIEMKVGSKKDSTGTKKVTLFENLGFSTSYDISADSLNWSPIAANARTRIGKFFTLQFNGSFDPYGLDSASERRINESWKSQEGKLLRLTSANIAVNFRLQGGKSKTKKKPKEYASEYGTEEELEDINLHPERYVDFQVPWSINVRYNIRYNKPAYEEFITQTMNFGGDIGLTENWRIGFNSGWDFERKDLTYTSVTIYRDLHCWQLAVDWIPYGPRQSYNITLNVKSSVLQDLKLNRRRDYFDLIE